jgi:guanyl-specific ribonuclease Sa
MTAVQSIDNPNWGGERVVTGNDGSAYYTPTHYQTYIVMDTGR